ncbi:MAG: hypothetical protein ABFD96_19290 [Armatimonadia bacterium]
MGTYFSVVLPLPEGPLAKERVEQWSEKTKAEHSAFIEDPHNWRYEAALHNVTWSLEKDGKIWLYSDDGEGNFENSVDFIQDYLTDFSIVGGVFVSAAQYPGKPFINESSGCSVVVTKDAQIWLHTDHVLRMAKEAGIEHILN